MSGEGEIHAVEILRCIPALALLDAADLERLAEAATLRKYKMGETLFHEGDPPDFLYGIAAGRVRVLGSGRGGEEVTLAVLEAGDYFGELGVLHGRPRTVAVRSSDESVILAIPGEAVRRILDARPEVRAAFEGLASLYGIRQFLRQCTEFGAVPAPLMAKVLYKFKKRACRSGETILREGEAGDALYVVARGTFDVYEGDKHQNLLGEGEIFGEISLLTARPRTASVRAASDGELYVLAKEDFEEVCHGAPDFRERLLRVMAAYDPLAPREKVHPPAPEAPAAPTPARPPQTDEAPAPKKKPRRWRYPFVAQQDETDCGAACLGMIGKFHGLRLSLSRLRDLANVTTEGSSLASLAVAGEGLGFSTRGLRISMARIDAVDLPVICHWGGNHWIVLWEIGPSYAVIGDPALGNKKIPREEFERGWSGHLLELRPTEALREVKPAKTSFGRFIPLLKQYRLLLFEVFLCSLLLDLFGLAQPLFTQVVVDKVFVHQAKDLLNALLAGMVCVAFFQAATSALRRVLLVHISTRIDVRLISEFLRHLMRLPVRYFDVRKVGDILARVEENESITRAFVGTIPTALLDVMMASLYIVLMSLYSVRLTALVLVLVVPFAVLVLGFTPIIRANRRELFARHATASSFLIENITGIHTVKALAVENPMRWKWEGFYHRVILETRRGAHIDIAQEVLAHLLSTLSGTFLFYYGARLVLGGSLSLGQLFAFNVLVGNVMTPLLGLVGLWDQIQALKISLDRLNDVFDSKPEEEPGRNLLVIPRIHGHIRFENVSFSYRSGREDKPVLNRISFELPAGTTCALVGRSGSGKTTISRLLLRFYAPQQGRIFIDGHDARTLSVPSLRRQIGIVPQDVVLFAGTIRENIALGDPDVSLERVAEAARNAGAHEFISAFPLGYDTPVGERGVSLSGGQRQRISIARAILYDPSILVLDEATSALDTESERSIQRNLETLAQGRTSIVIAHRLSTVQRADKILVLDEGGVVESGSHQELMEKRGLYSYLVTQQLPS